MGNYMLYIDNRFLQYLHSINMCIQHYMLNNHLRVNMLHIKIDMLDIYHWLNWDRNLVHNLNMYLNFNLNIIDNLLHYIGYIDLFVKDTR